MNPNWRWTSGVDWVPHLIRLLAACLVSFSSAADERIDMFSRLIVYCCNLQGQYTPEDIHPLIYTPLLFLFLGKWVSELMGGGPCLRFEGERSPPLLQLLPTLRHSFRSAGKRERVSAALPHFHTRY